jgi:superfamily II DNA/RNA helicase
VHRIGRTARAGKLGQSIMFLNEPEYPYISFLENKKVEIKEREIPESMKDPNTV